MSDPKTSPNSFDTNKVVAFQDRLYVAGNASFLCLVVAVLWSFVFITKLHFSLASLIVLASPLVATGVTVLLGGFSRSVVPKTHLSNPLQFSIPIIWCLLCYLAILLISTQETEASRVPDQLMPALAWSKLGNLVPVCVLQIVVLSLFVYIDRARSRV